MNKIKELRKKTGITLEKMASLLNLAPSTISQYESNKREAGYETLIAIAKLFNVSVDYLLGNSTELTSTSTALTSEQAKDLWLATLSQLDQDIISTVLKLNELQKYKVQAYMIGMLGQ